MKFPESPNAYYHPDAAMLRVIVEKPELMQPELEGRYLHWDEVRHRPPPNGLTSEALWWGIRIGRANLAKALPFSDAKDKPRKFTFAMTDTAQRLVHEIDRDASGRIELPEDLTSPTTRDRYIVNSLIEEAFRSSQLEGASTTRVVAKEMIRSKREPRNVSERMILNNFHAMEWVRENRNNALTPQMLFDLQRIVTRETLDIPDGAGRYRRADEDVHVIDNTDGEVVHTPPPATLLSSRMEALCKFANGTSRDEPFIHPVVRSILLHFWLAYDHPFVDGNGRTARALFYWSALRQGYWLTEFISISRAIKNARGQYENAFLFTETDNNDATYFVFNQLKVLRTAIDDLHTYLKRKAKEVRELESKLHGRDDLNNRQLTILNEVLRHPEARITIVSHQTTHRVVYQTARTDLLGLVELGYLEQKKQGKGFFFTPVRDLQRRLSPKK